MGTIYYLKDTGHISTAETGERQTNLCNAGQPIPIQVSGFSINAKSTAVAPTLPKDQSFTPFVIGKTFTELTIKASIVNLGKEIDQTIYLPDRDNEGEYLEIINPQPAAIIAILEDALGRKTHFDFYAMDSDGTYSSSGEAQIPYWLSQLRENTISNTTNMAHLNLTISNLSVNQTNPNKYEITLKTIVYK